MTKGWYRSSFPERCQRRTRSLISTNAWWGQSAHLTRGFSQIPLIHSLWQAGEYPVLPLRRFSNRRGNTSIRPLNKDLNNLILSPSEDSFVTVCIQQRLPPTECLLSCEKVKEKSCMTSKFWGASGYGLRTAIARVLFKSSLEFLFD